MPTAGTNPATCVWSPSSPKPLVEDLDQWRSDSITTTAYRKNQEWVAPALNTTADGSLYFSILDLVKRDAALYTEALLKRSSLQQMWTVAPLLDGKPNTGHYGFGWFVGEKNGHRLVEHEGQWQGFETQISRYIDDALTVVVLTNLGSAKPQRIAETIAKIHLSRPSSLPN